MKRIVTIQDISCVGKCSLTVALPVLSAMGVEAAILPTAVLSNHTMFSGFTYCDLTDQIEPIAAQWEKEGIEFDAVYTGYLGSHAQLGLMERFFDAQRKKGALIVVDPVMADNGKLYTGFDEAYAAANAKLCGHADVIVPNITEACFLTGQPYRTEYDQDYIKTLLQELAKLGPKQVALTGVSFSPETMGIMGLDTVTGEYYSYYTQRLPMSLHGTGDLFSSAAVGGLMNGMTLPQALALAADFVVQTLLCSRDDPQPQWYGASFERALPYLIRRLALDK